MLGGMALPLLYCARSEYADSDGPESEPARRAVQQTQTSVYPVCGPDTRALQLFPIENSIKCISNSSGLVLWAGYEVSRRCARRAILTIDGRARARWRECPRTQRTSTPSKLSITNPGHGFDLTLTTPTGGAKRSATQSHTPRRQRHRVEPIKSTQCDRYRTWTTKIQYPFAVKRDRRLSCSAYPSMVDRFNLRPTNGRLAGRPATGARSIKRPLLSGPNFLNRGDRLG